MSKRHNTHQKESCIKIYPRFVLMEYDKTGKHRIVRSAELYTHRAEKHVPTRPQGEHQHWSGGKGVSAERVACGSWRFGWKEWARQNMEAE